MTNGKGATIHGIHHVTAIAGDPQRNLDFYTGVLGLRLVKVTVNFDDPAAYHLYYGDGAGNPGSIMTFFPWPRAPKGRAGAGQVAVTTFSIPKASTGYWIGRLNDAAVAVDGPSERFGDSVLSFRDPDGLLLELAGTEAADPRTPWTGGTVPLEHAIRGFHSVSLWESDASVTAELLTGTLGMSSAGRMEDRTRYAMADGGPGKWVDIVPEQRRGMIAVGNVHHVAWRTPDDASQRQWLNLLTQAGHNVSPIMDRNYFNSIYFREPGGVLFEIATDPPGFAADEPVAKLGESLRLPPWMEPSRDSIRQALPALRTAAGVQLP